MTNDLPSGSAGRQPEAGAVTLDVINGPGSFLLRLPQHVASSVLIGASKVARVLFLLQPPTHSRDKRRKGMAPT